MTETSSLAPGVFAHDRQCGACGMCCKLFAIQALDKPEGKWCLHYGRAGGCSIYETRPEPCRNFECGYLVYAFLDDRWRPDRSKFVIWLNKKYARMMVEVDPAYPDAWKKEPYYSALKQWCRRKSPNAPEFMVKVGHQVTLLFPEADIPLGVVQDRAIDSGYEMAPGGRYAPYARWR